MTFRFGQRSLDNLKGVHPDLVMVVHRALEITACDFAVIDGLRTLEEQKELMNNGASTTLRSRHLTGHAIDLAPWIGGRLRWDWPPYYTIADAMQDAAIELDVPVRWGGSWELLNNIEVPLEVAVLQYSNRKIAQGKVPFPDGGHFELPRGVYP